MTLILFAILLGILLGLIGGMMPGIGNVTMLLMMFPILIQWPPEVTLLFYVGLLQCSNFTSSVSAINLGLLGDVSSEPALRERLHILKNKLVDQALKYSAIGSIVAVSITLLMLSFLMDWFGSSPIMLRTETRFLLVWTILISILWWPRNNVLSNLILVVFGIIIGSIGHHYIFLGYNDIHILTFGFTQIYAGIPLIAVLGAFLAVPSLINVSKSLSENKIDLVTDKTQHEEVKFSWASSLRGTTLGIFLGMVPLIGTMISSNVAWAFEKLFSKKKNLNQQSLNRLLAAESSNNSAAVTVLIPLLILGLAIIPSEMLLLSIIESVGWHPKNVTGDFYIKLYSALIAACLISYLFCYTFVIPFTKLFYKNFKILVYITFVIIVGSVYYSGSMHSNQIFFILCLSVFSFVVLLTYKYFDFIPLVAGYLLSSEVLNTTQIIHNLYF